MSSSICKGYERRGRLMMWGYGFGWGWMLMSFGMVLWIALLVILVWALIRWLSSKANTPFPTLTPTPQSGLSAEEILRQRYARGEIDAATFEQMRQRLEGSRPGSTQYENQPGMESRRFLRI